MAKQQQGKQNKTTGPASSGTTSNVSKTNDPSNTTPDPTLKPESLSDQNPTPGTVTPDSNSGSNSNPENAASTGSVQEGQPGQTDSTSGQDSGPDSTDGQQDGQDGGLPGQDTTDGQEDPNGDAKPAESASEAQEDGAGERVSPNLADAIRKHPGQTAPEGRILEVGDPLEFEGEKVGRSIVVKEDVYRRYIPRGAKRPSYDLLYRKGTVLSALSVELHNERVNSGENLIGGPGIV